MKLYVHYADTVVSPFSQTGMLREIILTALFVLFLAGVLFGSAGRVDWPMAWAFLSAYLAFAVAAFVVLDPELIRERARGGSGIDRLDVALATVSFIWSFPATLLIAGLDAGRFGWSPALPLAVQGAALAVFILGHAFAFWAMMANRFFSTFLRIQTERGHAVAAGGPYAYIRHPGYAGTILAVVVLPISLASLWALIPALLGAGLFVARTLHEDGTLQERLPGYRNYTARVRWRLAPGVW